MTSDAVFEVATEAQQKQIGAKDSKNSKSPKVKAIAKDTAKARDNAVTVQLVKTKMCAFFERGKCASTNCRYAHSAVELQRPPNLHKTKLCKAFLQGSCIDGENCMFAHGELDLRVTEGIYKTQICNFYERGYCKKGDRCNHAHGITDLRPTTPSTKATSPQPLATQQTPVPAAKVSEGSTHGDGSSQRRSPLPLAELLTDSEGNPNYILPSPTKSVTEIASLAFSPMPSSPMWPQMMPQSPTGTWGSVHEPMSMWPGPLDPVDILIEPQQQPVLHPPSLAQPIMPQVMPQLLSQALPQGLQPAAPPALLPPALPSVSPMMSQALPHGPLSAGAMMPLQQTPQEKIFQHDRLQQQVFQQATPQQQTPKTPPSNPIIAQESSVKESKSDPVVVDLSERLASLDAVVQGLAADVAGISGRKNGQRLHRI